ncbi:MAG: fatty acid desaturase [Dokdonella sp.]
MRDVRLAAVEWRDLIALSPFEVARELALPFVAFGFALLAGVAHCWPLLALAGGMMFMTGLRVTHGAFHNSLGLCGIANDALMFALSALLGGSMHAIEVTHLRHHRDCLADDDVEGRIARLGFWRALLDSPRYPLAIHRAALRHGSSRQRRWIVAELAVVAFTQALVWRNGGALLQGIAVSLYVANACAAIPGIWFVHRGCRHGDNAIARSTRSRWLAWLTIDMFHHAEHHAFPAVPTCHLHELARRFDAHAVTPPLIGEFSTARVNGFGTSSASTGGNDALARLSSGCAPGVTHRGSRGVMHVRIQPRRALSRVMK